MVLTLNLVCLVLALVAFIVAAGSVPTGRVNMIGVGLALCVVAFLLR